MQLNIDEAIDGLFKLVRTGMQWREVEVASASYSTVFKHAKRWVTEGIMHASYSQILHEHAKLHPEKYYIVDSCEKCVRPRAWGFDAPNEVDCLDGEEWRDVVL